VADSNGSANAVVNEWRAMFRRETANRTHAKKENDHAKRNRRAETLRPRYADAVQTGARGASLIAFEDRGGGAAVTFLHGFALDGRMWSAQARRIESTHRTIVVDLPGFGPGGGAHSGVHCPAEAVLEVLDARGVQRTHLVGHSFGGAVAVDIALAHADRVISLTLVDALLLGRASGIGAWPTCVSLAQKEQRDEARRAWLADPLFDPARRRPDVLLALERMASDYACNHWAGRLSSRWLVDEPANQLEGLRLPTLVINGELDTPPFRAMADEYERALPNAHRVTVPDAGHVSNLEAPAAFNEGLLALAWHHT
jgi:pimeloyl-ACP methyl ester carboxylesterase